MSLANNTPPLNAAGSYVVENPYTLNQSKTYVCESIEGFKDLEEQGIDVFETFYLPVGVPKSVYERDKDNQINIITLMCSEEPTLKIPSSYILKFPTQTSVPYSDLYMSISLGPMPDGLGFEDVRFKIMDVVRDLTGSDNVHVNLHKVSVPRVSPSDHEMLEANRRARILNQESVYKKLEKKTKALADLNLKNVGLKEALATILSK